MKRIKLNHALVVCMTVMLLTFLFVQQRPLDEAEHHAFAANLEAMKRLDAEINRDLLSSRFDLLTSYDPFVRKLRDMREARNGLKHIPSFITGRDKTAIEQLLKNESAVLDEKARLVETFKSQNAILRNSLRYFPILTEQTATSAPAGNDPRLRDHLATVLRDILLFDLMPHSDRATPLYTEIAVLSGDTARHPELAAKLNGVAAHATNIISVKPQVEHLIETLFALPSGTHLESITTAYEHAYDETQRVNEFYHLFMYLCSVVLLVYAADRTRHLFRSRSVLKRAVEELRAAQERYELAVRGANDGLWDWDLITGQMYFSPRWKEMLGFVPDELANSPSTWLDRLHPDDRDRVRHECEDHFENRTPVFESEHRVLHNDGDYRWMLSRGIAVRTSDGKAKRMAGSQTDITGNKSSDPLTGLANRLLFNERLSQIMRDVRRGRAADYSILFLDVDRFKIVNDSMGHAAGDALLLLISARLKSCFRATDLNTSGRGTSVVARLGGDEFAVLIDGTGDPQVVRSIADRVLAAFTQPFDVEGREIMATFSVGVAVGNAEYAIPEDILRDADIAMYEAKASGKARAEIFDPVMRERAVRRMENEADIRQGMERQEFTVLYQPKVDLRSRSITGFEALVRWNHPTRGLVSPAEFIPIAEETGLIVPLGYLVLENACLQLREWQQRNGSTKFTVSVNISCRQFAEPDLVEQIAAIMKRTGIAPGSLDLELTETAVMRDPEAASKTLLQLRALGIGLHMDDFGTGHSSLSYLQRFPFDTIKIDRSFVSGLGVASENRDLIRTIVKLAKSLKMKVVAEGVETDLQMAELKSLGCGYAQGYLFSRPVNSAAAGQMIAEKDREAERAMQEETLCAA